MEPGLLAVTMAEATYPNREALAAEQLEQLRSLVTELFPANKFYSNKLNAAGITVHHETGVGAGSIGESAVRHEPDLPA